MPAGSQTHPFLITRALTCCSRGSTSCRVARAGSYSQQRQLLLLRTLMTTTTALSHPVVVTPAAANRPPPSQGTCCLHPHPHTVRVVREARQGERQAMWCRATRPPQSGGRAPAPPHLLLQLLRPRTRQRSYHPVVPPAAAPWVACSPSPAERWPLPSAPSLAALLVRRRLPALVARGHKRCRGSLTRSQRSSLKRSSRRQLASPSRTRCNAQPHPPPLAVAAPVEE